VTSLRLWLVFPVPADVRDMLVRPEDWRGNQRRPG